MKSVILLALIILINGAAFASTEAEAIYSVLNVAAQPEAPNSWVYTKSVGGLTCSKYDSNNHEDDISYNCMIAISLINAEAVYSALNIEEKPLTADRTQLKYEKSVGGISCVKTNNIRMGESFSCSVLL
jgi:hypothetical protein